MKSEEVNPLDEVLNKKIEIFSYKFPNNSIYVGYCTYGLESRDKDHRKCGCSPIFSLLKEYTNVKPKVEVTVNNKSLREMYCIQRKIFDANPHMKILNKNLYLFGY